ncbi:MAG: hypothetical protein AAFX41_05245, partial [Bacteroidota bacterium]
LVSDEASGVGLRNTDRRLRTRYGAAARLHVEAPENGGVGVRFALPVPDGFMATRPKSAEVAV